MRTVCFLLHGAAAFVLAGCAGYAGYGGQDGGATARAELAPTRGNAASGVVTFRQMGDEVLVHARLQGLKPGQAHGFHVHEKGDCSSGDGMSAGGHFNPLGKPHGHFDSSERHVGDLPALMADAQGNAELRWRGKGLSVGAGVTDVIGHGLIVHAQPDDYKTQPTGNAGARMACAVIQRG